MPWSQSWKPFHDVHFLPHIAFKYYTLFLSKLPISFLLRFSSSDLLLSSYDHVDIPRTDPWFLYEFSLDGNLLSDTPAFMSSSHYHPSPVIAEPRSGIFKSILLNYILNALGEFPFEITWSLSEMLRNSLQKDNFHSKKKE